MRVREGKRERERERERMRERERERVRGNGCKGNTFLSERCKKNYRERESDK